MDLRINRIVTKFAYCFSMMFMLSACGIFDTREPEPPVTGNGFIWVDATSYQILLNNFEGSVEALDAENYKRVFISSSDSLQTGGTANYTFLYNSSLDPSSRVVFDNWNTESERNYLKRLKSVLIDNARLGLELKNVTSQQSSPNQVSINADYTLNIPAGSNTVVPNTVTGYLTMQLRLVKTERGTQEWRIVNWLDQDPKGGKAYSWTDLKANFSN
jgi:hypothetical protein